MEESLIDILLKLSEEDRNRVYSIFAKYPNTSAQPGDMLSNDVSGARLRREMFGELLQFETDKNLSGNSSILNNILSDVVKKNMGYPSGIDISSYVGDDSITEDERNSRKRDFMSKISYSLGIRGENLSGANYAETEFSKSLIENTKKLRMISYEGIPKVLNAIKLNDEYQENLNNKLKSGDAAQTITVEICPGLDRTKSPFEIYKKAYDKWILSPFDFTFPDPAAVFSEYINNPNSTLFTTPTEKASALAKLSADATAWLAENTGTGGYDPDLFVRGDRLAGGTPVSLDFGTLNGRYGKTEDVMKDAKDLGAKNLAEYVEEKINFLKPPNEIYTLMNSVVNSDGKPLAIDGKPLDYNYPGIDPTPGTGSREPQELSEEEKDIRLKIALKKLEPDLKDFASEFEKMKESHKPGNKLYKMKPNVLKAFFTSLSLVETWKWGKIAYTVSQLKAAGKPIPSLGHLYHEFHGLSQIVGVGETLLGIYKIITGVSNGKIGDPLRDFGFTVLGTIAEFSPGLIGLGYLETIGAGGLVGIFLTAMSVYMDYVMKPIAKKKNAKLLDTILDLERMWIEKECCVRIHPALYRKSVGQVLIPIMTSIDPNSITGIDIPVGSTYERGFEPDAPAQLPCQQGSSIQTPKRATVRRTSSKFMADPNVGGKTGLSGIPQTDKCKTPPKLEGSKTTTPDKLSLNDAIPYWNNQREIDYQDSMYAYNMEYVQREYQHKIDAAYCRSGIIQAGGSGAGYLDPAYDRGERIPVNFGDKFIPIYISRETLSNPVRPGRKTTEEWGGYWEREYGDSSGTDNSRGRGYGPVIPRGGGGGGGPTKEDTGEETGGLIRKPRRPV